MLLVLPALATPSFAQAESADAAAEAVRVRFNFKGAGFEQVVDFFARKVGLPVIWETTPPEGTLDYLSPESYEPREALKVLNIILQSKGVMLRISDDMLYLQKLEEMKREDIPTYVGTLPAEVTSDQIVTVVRALDLALAGPLAEKLAEMVATYGSVTALQDQNALVITETAAQVRRLIRIVEEIDREDPEGAIQIFKLQHTRASLLMEPLKALMSTTVERTVLDDKNKPQKIREQEMHGLSISHDERTNSIIAKGQERRITKLAETIALLDVPAISSARTVRSFDLVQIPAADAVAKVSSLFAARDKGEERPVVIPHTGSNRITVIGDDTDVAEASVVLKEIDGGGAATAADTDRDVVVLTLRHAEPAAIVTALTSLLNDRQKATTKLLPGPDGASVIAAGLAPDVESVRALVPALDRPARVDRQVRLLRLTARDPADLFARSRAIYERQADPKDPRDELQAELDEASRTLTLVGTSAAIDRFSDAMRMARETTVVDRETRQFALANATPSTVAKSLAALAGPLLATPDGAEVPAPEITPIDELDVLLVTAAPEQFGVIKAIVGTLDRPAPGDFRFQVVPMGKVGDPDALTERTAAIFARLARGAGDDVRAPDVEHDRDTGNLVISGSAPAVELYERALAEARHLAPPAREGRLLALAYAEADDIVGPLLALLKTTAPRDPARAVPEPEIEVVERTNSLYVIAEPAQHDAIARLVRDLDTLEPADLPPLRLIQLRAADAGEIAALLRRRYDARPNEQRREKPVSIDADAGTNTLIITAHADVYEEIRDFVSGINRADGGPERETMLFTLERARATDLATALDKLYPAPPVPQDRRGRALTHLQEPKEVLVSADAATNTLIIEAPAERRASFEALVEQLDRVELPPRAALRTYHIERGDPERIARTLTQLAKVGVLSETPPDGGQPVTVTVEVEPLSRTLIVAGDDLTFTTVERMLDDLEAVPVPRTLRVIEVDGTDPRTLADRAMRLYEEQTSDDPLARPVSVEVDNENSTLLVVAGDEAMFRFSTILTQLQGAIAPPPDVRLRTLVNAEAARVAATLTDMVDSATLLGTRVGPPPQFEVIERTNALLIAAQPDQHSIIEALIDGLDQPEQGEMPPVRILQLDAADARNLAGALAAHYDRRALEMRTAKPVSITADAKTNSLLVAAHPEMFPEILAVVEDLNDAERRKYDGREIRIFPLRTARAEDLAVTLDEMFPQPPAPADRWGRPQTELRPAREVLVRADPRTNSIIVEAPSHRMEGFEELVNRLDGVELAAGAGTATSLRLFRLEHARAESLAPMLREILLTRINAEIPGGATADVQALLNVTADRKSNTLILSAPDAVMPVAEELIRQLDDPTARVGEEIVRVRPLMYAEAEEVGRAIGAAMPAMRNDAGDPLEVKVIAAPASRALILVGLAADIDALEPVIEPLDGRPPSDATDARTFALEYADAVEIAPLVQGLVADQFANDPRIMIERIRRGRGQIEPVAKISVQPIARTNSLIVTGPQQTLALAAGIIERIDRPGDAEARVYDTFTPAQGAPATLAAATERIMAATTGEGRRAKIELIPDEAAGTILVVGPRDEVDRALALLEERDDATPTAPQMDFRLVDLRHSDAAAVAQAVGPMLADRGRWPASLQAAVRAGLAVGQPTVTAEASRNRLFVSAPRELMPVAMQLVDDMDVPRDGAGGAVDVRIFTLEQAKAGDVVAALEAAAAARAAARPGAPAPSIVAEPSSNSIVVTAATDEIDALAAIVARLDEGHAVDRAQVRTVFLRHARAETVAPIVEQLLAGEEVPAWLRINAFTRGRDLPDLGPDVRVAADRRLNAVIVSAPPSILSIAEEMVAQLDVDPGSDRVAPRSVRVVAVQNSDAAALAENLESLFEETELGEQPPAFRVDAASNSLLVRASEEQFRRIERLVREIDSATLTTSHDIRLVPIDPSRAKAADVAESLRRILDRSGGGGVEVMTLEELLNRRAPESGSAAPPAGSSSRRGDERQRASHLCGRPGQGPAALASGSAPRYATMLALAALGQVLPSDDEPAVTIAVDPATNSIVIVGSPRAVERVKALAEQMQSELPAAPGRVRYIALPLETDADMLVRMVDRTLQQLAPPGGARGDVRRRVGLVADTINNAVIVTATDNDFETIGDLLAALARPPAAERVVVKVYPLETLTADRAVARLQQILRGDGRQADRMRSLAVTLLDGDQEIDAVFNPQRISAAADAQTNALIVSAPGEAIGFLDRYIEMIDQSPVNVQTTLKMYPLEQARAIELRDTLRGLFRARFRSMRDRAGSVIEPEFAADERTNTLMVTAAPEQLAEVDVLLADLDRSLGDGLQPLRSIELAASLPSRAAEIIRDVVIGTDQARRASTVIVPDDNSGVLLVRAPDDVRAEIDAVLAEIDRDASRAFDVRTITLERADAAAVAGALQRFFDDRARIASSGRGRREQTRRVSIIGDPASRTLLVSASDEDFAQIEQLVARFDSPQATDVVEFRVFPLRHAKAEEIETTVSQLLDDLTWNQPFWWMGGQETGREGKVAIQADTRLNAIIATGDGEKFEMVGRLIDILDAPEPEGERRLVKLYRLQHASLSIVEGLITELFTDTTRGRRFWMPANPNELKIRRDERTRTLIVSGSAREHEEIAALIASVDEDAGDAQQVTVVPVEFADVTEVARSLTRFLEDRARAAGLTRPGATVVASASTGSLVVSASEDELSMVRDLLAKLDLPDVTGDRVTGIIALGEGDAEEIARIVREQFGRRGGGAGVVVTADLRTGSLIISAPRRQFAEARALVEQLDAPRASDETIIRSYALEGARAEEAVRILTSALRLDASGETEGITIKLDEETPAVEVKAKITADPRSNSLMVTATSASFPVIESLIRKLDDVPASSPIEYHIVPLEHALADEMVYTLRLVGRWEGDAPEPRFDFNRLENQLIIAATPDQFEQISAIVERMDQPSTRQRTTDFVPLQFAEAEKIAEALSVFYGPLAFEADTPGKLNVRIVADPATNSLVITADDQEWDDIRTLLGKLDSEDYDSSLQLRVIPLLYADAGSVADAINEAFQGRLERDRRADRGRGNADRDRSRDEEDRRDQPGPSVLVESEEWVRASAETQTNSVIVSASRQNIRKIEQIIAELDVADYAQLPAPRLIPVDRGDPEQLAESLNRLYAQEGSDRGRRALRIVGDKGSNTLIVRAEDEDFRQITTLADALQQEAASGGLAVHVLRLQTAPARRVQEAIIAAYAAKAEQANQPLSIEVDAAGNSLIIACTLGLFQDIRETVDQLDALAPAAGQGIFIIELENIAPQEAQRVIETMGLHRPADDSVSKLVTEPIRISILEGRNAVIVIANPGDRDTIVGLLKALDAEPKLGDADVRVVHLKNAAAPALARILAEVLSPSAQQVETPIARALQEQVRRLAVQRDGIDDEVIALDLTKPIRVVADPGMNALIISSTPANARAVADLAAMFDALPITDAVAVQIFPLDNIPAAQFVRIVNDLFQQGKALANVAGTNLRGVPGGVVGRALLEEIAITVDERTNTVIVAGKEDSVAFVEVLTQRLDSEIAGGWVEPRIVQLKYADASDLAATLQAILVEGVNELPGSDPLQRQVGRLRMARRDDNGGRVLESDVFQPMTRLLVRPEPQLNAVILVGTPENLEVVTELIAMLDIEAASPDATVRIYPVENASAARLGTLITSLFDQQVQSKAIRPEDRVIVQADDRTNALVVTTSPRSFAVLESLLRTLDVEVAPDLREIRRIPLEFASAARLAPLIQQLMDARLERLRQVQPETAELERASLVSDPRTNSLVVAAGNESFEVIRRLAAELDGSGLTDLSLVRVLPLENGNAERIAETIDAVMDRRYADLPQELRTAQKPLVTTDPRSNSLLVAANPEDMTAIEDLVARLEAAPSNPAVGLHVVALPPTVRAESVAPRLDRLMTERQQSLGDARDASDNITIEPDPVGNTLVVAASDENAEAVRALVDMLVEAESNAVRGRAFELIPIVTSRAQDVADLLDELYVREVNRTRGENTVQVTADERVNALVVNAPWADIEVIEDLVKQLDGAKPASVVEIKYIALESANALETVSLIQNVLSGRGIGAAAGSRRSTVLKYLREIAREAGEDVPDMVSDAEMEVSAAIRESIVLTPDLRTNTIIVSAPRQSMDMIERMIRDLDASSTGAKSIRIFKLVNADATAMAEILTDLFNLRQGSNLLVLKPRESETRVGAGPGPDGATTVAGIDGADLTAVPDERQQLSITVDSRTNSLLVSGTPTYLDLVASVVEELDALEANERETYVYRLRNADALEVARVLTDFVQQEQQKLVGTLSPDQLGSAARVLEREVTIQGDQKSNAVLVSASPRYMSSVKQMIEQLDVDPPQVLIQVMLAEVTLDSGDEWGIDMEFRASDGNGMLTAGFGLASAFVTGMGVPSLAIATSDFDLLIRAMQEQGRLQVLSNPSIMAANNEPASIQIGETIRVAEATSFTESGQSNTSLIEEELGVILNVTPSINPDGFVRMSVQPTISLLSDRVTQINEDLSSPVIIVRTAETTVTVFDGQTIVIGGLIQDRFEKRERKVPFFGDIPLIGAFFRQESETASTTELLIVLTPHVIESPTHLGRVDAVTAEELRRLSLSPELIEEIRRGKLDVSGGLYDAKGNRIDAGWTRPAEGDEE